jgi:hypothetical protein
MIINDNKETVTCRICGEQCKRIYGKHLKFAHNNMTTKEYKELYEGAPIMALSDKAKTTINGGKHMKKEKYKKMFAEKIRGTKNPNHKKNTTELERKSRSPFSKNFSKYEGVENIEEHISIFAKEAIKDRISDTTLEYYLLKGYDEETSKKMLSERQSTFSLKKCVEKHGDVGGKKRWLDRQTLWQKNLAENGNMKCGYSEISQDLFKKISKIYTDNELKRVHYAIKNKEFFISVKDVGFFSYDFTDRKRMKIIEYNGDLYHANPKTFKENDYPHPFYKESGPTAREIWDKDNLKINIAKSKGFDILIIWDTEYKSKKDLTIKKCIDFLNNV